MEWNVVCQQSFTNNRTTQPASAIFTTSAARNDSSLTLWTIRTVEINMIHEINYSTDVHRTSVSKHALSESQTHYSGPNDADAICLPFPTP